MKRTFTKLTAALALLTLLVPIGAWGQGTTVASFSRSGTTNTTSGGTFTATFSGKSGYYQDDSGERYMQILNNSAYWTTTPNSISFAAVIGGGSGNTDLTDPVYVALLDANGNVISGTQTAVTSHITTNTGDNYNITIPATNNVYGVKLSHNKQNGFNVRYFSFSLSYVAGGGDTPSAVATTTTITVPDNFKYDVKDGPTAGTLTATVTDNDTEEEISGAEVTWESNNTAVATVNASGVVTLVAEGTVKITATYDGEEDVYEGSSDEYEFEVVDTRYLISNLTFTAACNGSGTASTDDQAAWTVTSDGTESNFIAGAGIHYGTNSAAVTYVQLATSDIDGIISKVVVNTRDAQATAGVTVTVGNTSFTCGGNTSVTATNTSTDYTFTGTGSGEIVVRIDRGSSMTKAIYVLSVKVYYQEPAVAAPVITVPETFVGSTNVTITCATEDAAIVYNFDGGTTWNDYPAGGFTITETTTIYAKAVKDADESSVVSKTTTKVHPTPTVAIDATGILNTDVYTSTEAGSLTASVTYDDDPVTGTTVTWSGSNDAVATIDATTGAVTLVGAGSVTFTASFAGNNDYEAASSTYVMTVTNSDPNAPGTMNNPYNVAQARAAINAGTGITDVYVRGIVSYSNSLSGGEITYRISDDGTENDEIQVYRGKGINGDDFTDSDDIQVGDVVVVYGTLSLYGSSTYQFNYGNHLVSLTRPASITVIPATANPSATDVEGTLAITYANLTISDMDDFDVQFCDSEGNALASGNEPDWIEVLIAEDNNEYLVSYTMDANEGYARTAYFKVYANDDQSNVVYSNLVTITQGAYVVPSASVSWVSTSLANLTEDDVFVIVGTINKGTFALPSESVSGQNAPAAVAVTVAEGTLSAEPAAELQWNLAGNSEDGYTFYVNGNHNSWLYCNTTASSSSNNNMRVVVSGNVNRNVFVLNEANYLVTNDDYEDRYLSIYVDNNGTAQDWRGYLNTSNNPAAISFYKKVEASTPETCTLNVAGYAEGNDKGGYRLIASPVLVHPSEVDGMTEGDYDLYKFDQSKNEAEWRNYKKEQFYLIPGKGYLYAKKGASENFEFSLEGVAYDGDGVIELTYTPDAEFAGWNLVGNPFGSAATISKAYYAMNALGSGFVPKTQNDQVAVMQGVFVYTEEASTVTFTKIEDTPVNPVEPETNMIINITKERGTVIDRAIVRFGQSDQLPKFMFNPNASKLYIPQGNKEFAVVNSANEGEMPVSFKAETRGTYTLSVNPENVEMTYLHLIDNLTGADVDLLATPSYTFEASNDDYESRFRLVFKANADVEENAATETFAYFNGSEWQISNVGGATLQVVDMLGRVLSSETISGNANVNINQAAGIYMLRLVNGENVMVQKVVVR